MQKSYTDDVILNRKAVKDLKYKESRKTEYSGILEYMQHRNEINEQLNVMLTELTSEGSVDVLIPFIEKLTLFMNQDILLVGRQYISFDEAIYLVCGDNIR